MLVDMPPGWSLSDQANADFLKIRYANRAHLERDWLEKRDIADKNKILENGKPNPNYPRMELQEQLARALYDMSYLVESLRIMQEQIDILSALFQRVGLLEGAYSHLKMSTEHVKDFYQEALIKIVEERRAMRNNVETQKEKG